MKRYHTAWWSTNAPRQPKIQVNPMMHDICKRHKQNSCYYSLIWGCLIKDYDKSGTRTTSTILPYAGSLPISSISQFGVPYRSKTTFKTAVQPGSTPQVIVQPGKRQPGDHLKGMRLFTFKDIDIILLVLKLLGTFLYSKYIERPPCPFHNIDIIKLSSCINRFIGDQVSDAKRRTRFNCIELFCLANSRLAEVSRIPVRNST